MNVRNPDITGPCRHLKIGARIRAQHERIKNTTTHPALTGEGGDIKVLAMESMHIAQSRGLIFDVDGTDTEGQTNLYTHLFGLKIEDYREIYERITLSARLYERYKPALKRTVA